MELWSLYDGIGMVTLTFGHIEPNDPHYSQLLLVNALIAALIGTVFFILQGIGLYCMAKKRGIGRRALAFVPFANILLMGRLAGEVTFFGHKIKRAGLFAMIAQILVTVLAFSYIASDIYLHHSGCIRYETADDALEQLRALWNGGTRFDRIIYNYYYDVVYLVEMIFGLAFEIMMFVLLIGLFKKYNPEGYMWMAIVTLLIPISRCVLVFVLRNRKAVDYGAYMRAKREAYMHRNQPHYGPNGGYGSPYGGYGPQGYGQNHGQNYGGQNAPSGQPQEPFSEFSSDKKSDDPFGEFSADSTGEKDGNSDGFFD